MRKDEVDPTFCIAPSIKDPDCRAARFMDKGKGCMCVGDECQNPKARGKR